MHCHPEPAKDLLMVAIPAWHATMWNVINNKQSALVQDYENLILTYSNDYHQSRAQEFDQTISKDFFNSFGMQTASFVNKQQFDWEGLKGRLLSTSYIPVPLRISVLEQPILH